VVACGALAGHIRDIAARRGWQLDAHTQLEDVAQVCWADETPRLAYAPQLRTAEGNLHYYSFLSRDEELDRVNALFGHWLIARNAQAMRDPAWWARVKGGAEPGRPQRAAATADADSLGVAP